MEELIQELIVTNERGIHARPAALLSQLAAKADAEIMFEHNGEETDCRSLLGLLMMAAGCGAKLTLRAKGRDAKKCVDQIVKMFEEKFNED